MAKYEYHPENGRCPHVVLWRPWNDAREIWLAYPAKEDADRKIAAVGVR